MSELLDFSKDLVHLEPASKVCHLYGSEYVTLFAAY